MSKIDIGWMIVSCLVTVVAFIGTMNLILSLVIFVIYVGYYFIFARKKFVKYLTQIDRVHTCYHFINSFLVTLSVKESFEDAYQSAIRLDNKALREQVENISQLNVYDRVNYLRDYFNLAIYKLFLNILDLYQNQGGNILTMSENLIRECTRTEKTITESSTIGNKHLLEFTILWLMSFLIILFMRFSISSFYKIMVAKPLFISMIFIFFLVCLVSTHLFICKFTNLTIKEDSGQ